MNCTQCATEIKDESANFCQNCAAPVTRGVTQPKQMGTDGATESSQESKSEPVAVSEFGELKISQVPKSWNPIKRYGLLAVVILIVAISVLIFVRNVNDGSNAQEAFPSGCVALETNINQSTGSERVKFMKLASEQGCKIQAKPAPTTSTFSLPSMTTWYPKGYREYTDGLAWKWTDESCGYSSGYCWTMRVKTRDGCAEGVYAEANIEQKGVVIGYTNDTLGSLRPGATAKLAFTHFGGSGTLSASLTKVTCYNY